MWLIETSSLELKFFIEAKKGSYAILSHTWEEGEEITFEELRSLRTASPEHRNKLSRRRGFVKILETCKIASDRGLSYAWADTCCIDKSSSAELSEAINSMFAYYRDAAFCIAFIADLPDTSHASNPNDDFNKYFPRCRWLTRGWTLQELIAPERLEFYDLTWTFRGTKSEHWFVLWDVTGVEKAILENPQALRSVPVGRRMSWASKRQTTRIEDMAYSLLGIFDVNMPLIYGEGIKAFKRLQGEIAKESYDLSLFAWQQQPGCVQEYRGVLAISVAEFSNFCNIDKRAAIPQEVVLTNRGLLIEAALVEIDSETGDGKSLVLNLGFTSCETWPYYVREGWVGIYLVQTPEGFVRVRPTELFQTGPTEMFGAKDHFQKRRSPGPVYIRTVVSFEECDKIARRFDRAVKVICDDRITIDSVVPKRLWVEDESCFLHQGRGINAYVRCSIQLPDGTIQSFIVACSSMFSLICVIWDVHDPLWADVDQFLQNSNERTDFLGIDYLKRHFLRLWDSVASSKATRDLENPATGAYLRVAAKIRECLIYENSRGFILNITI